MDVISVFLSLALALVALTNGQWFALILFNAVGLGLGWQYIPAVFGILSAINLGYALFLRAHPGAGHRARLE